MLTHSVKSQALSAIAYLFLRYAYFKETSEALDGEFASFFSILATSSNEDGKQEFLEYMESEIECIDTEANHKCDLKNALDEYLGDTETEKKLKDRILGLYPNTQPTIN